MRLTFKTNHIEERGSWFSFYPKFNKCQFRLEYWWYFDPRPKLITNITTLLMFVGIILGFISSPFFFISLIFIFIGWGELYLSLPVDTGKGQECDNPSIGFYFDCTDAPEWKLFDYLVICTGANPDTKGNTYIYMPWDFNHYRTSLLLKGKEDYMKDWESWAHSMPGFKKKFYEDEWKSLRYEETYDYTDSYDGEVIPCTIAVEQREWRRRGLMFTPLFNKVRTSIHIEFSKEVGKEKGSWKGGCTGCGYTLKIDETPLECIKRMEKERKF